MTIEHILVQYDFKKRTENLTLKISEVENQIGFPLPKDYVRYEENNYDYLESNKT